MYNVCTCICMYNYTMCTLALHSHLNCELWPKLYVVDIPPLSVGMVEEVEKDEIGSVIRLTCRGQVYSEIGDPEVSIYSTLCHRPLLVP